MTQIPRIALIMIVAFMTVACRQELALSAENINFSVSVSDLLVGETSLIITVLDDEDNPIQEPGTVSVRGDMDHAGMVPVIREATESTDGVFVIPFEWTMGGAWTVEVTLTTANGDVITETFAYEILTEAGDDMSGMDAESEPDMSEMAMGGETSAVYMSITNNGDDAVNILSAQTSAAALVEIHETIVTNDVARMQPIEMLVIESGETVDLMPGGKHIMLMQLTQDMAIGNSIDLTLMLESGEPITVTALVQDMPMDPLEGEVSAGDLVISNIWARPASAGGMSGMDHSMMDSVSGTDD